MDDPGRPRYPEFYHPLAPEFARVFELEPGEFSDPIVGRLVPQAIDGEPYEAVSYVWGDPRKRRDITIDGATLSVTKNLHGALAAFRHRPPSGSGNGSDPGTGPAQRQVRRLWVDAVCINQEDMPERISQVEQMARIYAGARRVLAWLGWEEGEEGRGHTQDAIRFIHSFMEDPEAGLCDARILLHHDLADPAGHLALLSEDDRRRFEEQTRKWEAVKFFFEIEYFHRTWIVQELGLAREAIMYTALKPDDGAEAGEDAGHEEAAESKDRDLELDFVDWPLVGKFVKFLDYSGASLVTQLGLMSWVAHHILMVWEMKEDGTPNCDFLTGMHWTRILRVTDARDRVYGLLGHPMAVIDGDLVIKPDYTHTRGVIYTKLAANFIRKTKNLYVVSLVDHEDDPSVEARDWDAQDESRMPSWVPDWHSINRTTPLDYPIAAAGVEDAEIRIEGETEGAEGTPLPHLLVRGWVVDEISAVSRRMETTDFPVTHLARERAKENPFWLDRVWELVFPADGHTDRDALAVLETLSLALPLGTREKDQPVGKAGLNQTLEEHHRSFAAYVFEYHELRRGASEASGIGIDDDNSYLPARSLFDSLPAEAQAELRRRAEGATSGGFIDCMTWPSMCRVVYRTMSGLVGMGSRVTRPGDLVCRVRGLPVLMTLRRIRDSGADRGTATGTGTDAAAPISCAHIGPTVVPARMKRGLVDGGEFGEEAAHFRIV
ncbi:heterokaryon incompatibility protein-domain-containing protein [Dactylonectria macrodidyma]|uniref:Heterokaryon incompatibility protein-domain-containing protein n=1 Tax=Dactylonectria macrodidyma TaxID=307937 RepID=A0A9P9E4R2_9HYPO|nr:heterokaryon incompatibility protein-domain-containing protein [Dactylonectria macrodidyma]